MHKTVLANEFPAKACPLSYRLPLYEKIAKEAEAAGDQAGADALRQECKDCCRKTKNKFLSDKALFSHLGANSDDGHFFHRLALQALAQRIAEGPLGPKGESHLFPATNVSAQNIRNRFPELMLMRARRARLACATTHKCMSQTRGRSGLSATTPQMQWQAATDPQGRTYYYSSTGQTTWTRPAGLVTP